ncbi:MAG: hypothetical protein ACREDU_04210, partial [Methylocella sp.]
MAKRLGGPVLMTILNSLWRAAIRMLAMAVIASGASGCASGWMDGIWGDSSSTQTASLTSAGGNALSPGLGSANEGDEVAKLYN